MIEGWHLILTGIGTCVVVFSFVWNFNRARKKDFNEAMEKKADKEIVSKELELRDTKIESMDAFLKEQNRHIREILEEQHCILENVQGDIKELMKKAS